MAAQDYDAQLLESVSVRRRRLRDALLYGPERTRRTADEKLGKLFGGIAIAAVMCAGCVGWSFISAKMAEKDDTAKSAPASVASYTTAYTTASSTAATSSTTASSTAATADHPVVSSEPEGGPAAARGRHGPGRGPMVGSVEW